MTDIEQKALALVNEVRAEDSGFASVDLTHLRHADMEELKAALLRAIEQHEAFRQEVSDAVGAYIHDPQSITGPATMQHLRRFIIAKPDPLVEAIKDCELATLDGIEEGVAYDLRAAIEKRGGKIIFNEEQN